MITTILFTLLVSFSTIKTMSIEETCKQQPIPTIDIAPGVKLIQNPSHELQLLLVARSDENEISFYQKILSVNNNNNQFPKTTLQELISDTKIVAIKKVNNESYRVVTPHMTIETWRNGTETRRTYYKNIKKDTIRSIQVGYENLREEEGDAAFYDAVKEEYEKKHKNYCCLII